MRGFNVHAYLEQLATKPSVLSSTQREACLCGLVCKS